MNLVDRGVWVPGGNPDLLGLELALHMVDRVGEGTASGAGRAAIRGSKDELCAVFHLGSVAASHCPEPGASRPPSAQDTPDWSWTPCSL